MNGRFRSLLIVVFLVGFAVNSWAFRCQVCGKDGFTSTGVLIYTDWVTGEREYVCNDCQKLPRCYICGLPVRDGGKKLSDGRVLCTRDARVAVVDIDEARRTCIEIENELNRTYSRFTEFPTDVDINVIDRVDWDSMTGGFSEHPSILGLYHPEETDGKVHHTIRLMTGQPADRLRNVCAHELSHAWVKQNVSAERHQRIARDAEEGFCEMMAYLLMDVEHNEAEKKRILANFYTRGQVKLFVETEQRYGFEDILDWMRYGTTAQLEEGHLDWIRKVDTQAAKPVAGSNTNSAPANTLPPAPPRPAPTSLELEGVLPGPHPMAIINHHTFTVGDEAKVKVGAADQTIRCLAIQKDSVHIKDTATGKEQDLLLSR